eukprot:Pgem_evm1s14978
MKLPYNPNEKVDHFPKTLEEQNELRLLLKLLHATHPQPTQVKRQSPRPKQLELELEAPLEPKSKPTPQLWQPLRKQQKEHIDVQSNKH